MGTALIVIYIFIIVFIFFFMINIIDYMKRTLSQREDQIAQMDRFIELYQKANGLDRELDREEK